MIDSSGLAVHAGQLRRAPKSRDYRKLHLCVDEQTGEVVAGELTSKRARDSSRVASLVGQIDSPISSARADTAYDASGVYEAIENHSAYSSHRERGFQSKLNSESIEAERSSKRWSVDGPPFH